ncbi:TNF receptor-associated factor 6-A [Xenopus laevis]|uniref:TNF receptor-associated factor 6-A n=1 Tax=Xenopus laevis TaxID=8355 RepID=UPI00005DC650|nr:TNF receptor-associated factor 6-A [Xenopus laevis]AAI08563.1 MGC131035 protein [Xenopus laevis]
MSILNPRTSLEAGDSEDACCAAMASVCCINTKEDADSPSAGLPSGTTQNLDVEEIQGYDVEFDPPLESKYECPICLMALREAVQTPCGHRFCKACILKSLRNAGHKCPVDNEILMEKQLFPDNFAKREILSLRVKCPNLGCTDTMELRHLEHHLVQCQFASIECSQCQGSFLKLLLDKHMEHECGRRRTFCDNCGLAMAYEDKSGHELICPMAYVTCDYCQTNLIREQMPAHYSMDCTMAPIPCMYCEFGCREKMQRHNLAGHLQDFTQAHMRMMAQTLRSFSTTPTSHISDISFCDPNQFEPVPLSVAPAHPSHMPSQQDCSQETRNLRETVEQLEGRLVRQDHQIRELIAKMETQCTYVNELKHTIHSLEDKVADMDAHRCNGVFIWRIKGFSGLQKSQEEEKPVVIHSPGFYTGDPGYKLCLRLHLQLPSAQRCANYISLFVHTMQGDYDSLLPWPLQGTIRLSILDQSESTARQDQVEVMDTKPDLLAFQRPTAPRNPKGFGYVTFMHLNTLKQRQYVKNDTLLVRCSVNIHLDLTSPRREGFQPRSGEGTL